MKTKELQLQEAMEDSVYELEKAKMAIREIIEDYGCYDAKLSPEKALKYRSAIGDELKACTMDEKLSDLFLSDYSRIMWLVEVIMDYCNNAIHLLKKELD